MILTNKPARAVSVIDLERWGGFLIRNSDLANDSNVVKVSDTWSYSRAPTSEIIQDLKWYHTSKLFAVLTVVLAVMLFVFLATGVPFAGVTFLASLVTALLFATSIPWVLGALNERLGGFFIESVSKERIDEDSTAVIAKALQVVKIVFGRERENVRLSADALDVLISNALVISEQMTHLSALSPIQPFQEALGLRVQDRLFACQALAQAISEMDCAHSRLRKAQQLPAIAHQAHHTDKLFGDGAEEYPKRAMGEYLDSNGSEYAQARRTLIEKTEELRLLPV